MATPFKRTQEQRDYQYILQQEMQQRRMTAKDVQRQQPHSFSNYDEYYGQQRRKIEAERKKYLDNFLNVKL